MGKKIRILALICVIAAVSFFRPVTARAEIASGTCGTCVWNISDDGTLTISPANGTSGTLDSIIYSYGWPWYSNRANVKKVVVEEGVAAGTSTSGMFNTMSNCTDFQISSLDTSNVTDMLNMFYGCTSLADTSGLAGLNTSNVTDMRQMFGNCTSLTDTSGLAGWNTSNVTTMNYMFERCSAISDVSGLAGWDTGKVTDMSSMFSRCTSLADTSDLADWDTGNVTGMSSMFYGCTSLADTSGLAGWDTGNVTGMGSMFYGCTSLADTSGLADWNTEKVTYMSSMFDDCTSLADTSGLAGWNTSNVTKMESMFSGCSSLANTSGLAGWDTGNVTSMNGMFYGCTSITDTSNLADWDTGSVTNMGNMFSDCTSLADTSGLVDWDTGNVTNMHYMFSSCTSLVDTSGFADWDTGNVTNMYYMFSGCGSLADISGLADWDTGKVTSMNNMFDGCTSLADISGLSGWNTSLVRYMNYMFRNCKSITGSSAFTDWDTGNVLNIEHMFQNCSSLADSSGFKDWDTGSVTNMNYTFSGCSRLADVSGLADWDTGNVTGMNFMFYSCGSLTDISSLGGWDTKYVRNMESMFNMEDTFDGRSSLAKAGLSGWDTGMVTNMRNMFALCTSLEELDMSGWDTSKVTSFNGMFNRDSELKRVKLGENVKFNGSGISYSGDKLSLPSPPNSTQDGVRYSGRWIREDEAYGPYTSAQLRDNYTPDMAGWWIWQADSSNGVVWFDANGGYTTAGQVSSTSTSGQITMPDKTTTTRLGYALSGWNTKADGTGTTYQPGETYNDVFEMGRNKPLYAMWEETDIRPYRVKVYMQRSSLNGYDLYSDEILEADKNTDVTYTPESHNGFVTPDPVTAAVSEDGKTVLKVYYDRNTYSVIFDRNGADFGSMQPVTLPAGVQKELPANSYIKEKSIFTGWNTEADGSGTTYTDKQAVKDLASENGAQVTLYAQWLTNDNSTSPTQGQIEVTLKGGQTIVIPELPAGTAYDIEEIDIPEGWTMERTDNGEGVIVSNRTSNGEVVNTYSAQGQISLSAHKTVTNGALKEGQFKFVLKDPDGNIVDTKTNGITDMDETVSVNENDEANPWYGTAPVDFDPVYFTQDDIGKTYTYTISETDMDDENIIYDTHTEEVVISIEDAGKGNLLVTAEYDEDGPLFRNEMKTGSLKVEKHLQDVPDSLQDTQFEFRLKVSTQDGRDLEGPFTVKKYPADSTTETVSVVSHTDNVDDEGNMLETLTSAGGYYVTDVISIPEAENVHVEVRYSGPYSCPEFCLWQGNVLDQVQDSGYVYSNRQNAFKYYPYSVPDSVRTDEFDMEGNTLTVTYYKIISNDANGYGYYVKMTGDVGAGPAETVDITSGETFTMSAGEHAIIEGLPIGAVYTVEEVEKTNWEIVSSYGTTGNVTSEEQAAAFTNSYGRDLIGSAVIEADKTFTNGDISSEEFTFILEEGGREIARKQADSSGHVRFDEIVYSAGQTGTYHYTIREVADGSKGYIAYDSHTEEVTVTVADNGNPALDVDIAYDSDGAVFTNVHDQTLKFLKKGYDGELLAGASIMITAEKDLSRAAVTGADDVSISAEQVTFKTKGQEVVITGLPSGNITFTETSAPEGYLTADPVTMNDPDAEEVIMTDPLEERDIVISKKDIAGSELAGAVLRVTGTTIAGDAIEPIEWTTAADAPKTIKVLPGEYVLHEVSVPDAAIYVQAKDIAFTVALDGSVKVNNEAVNAVVMTDVYNEHQIVILKKDINGALLPGASLKITGTDLSGRAVDEILIESGTEASIVTMLPGTYTLTETNAPEGFEKAAPVEFKVSASGAVSIKQADGTYEDVQAVEMTDPCTVYDLSVSKRVTGAFGNKTHIFSFELELTGDYAGETVSYTLNGEEKTLELTDGKGTFRLGHGDTAVFKDIAKGTAYKVTETDGESRGYEVTYTDNEGTVTKDTQVSVQNNMGGWVPTDLTFPQAVFILLAAAAAAGTAFITYRRKKQK